MLKLVQFSQDSCFYEYRESKTNNPNQFYDDAPLMKDTIDCDFFHNVRELFNQIDNEDLLRHQKNIWISDGFRISLSISNGNSKVIYQIHTPNKKDEQIHDFKVCADMMLNLVDRSWNKWIK